MTIEYRFGLLYLAISLCFLVSCGGDEFLVFEDSGIAAEDAKPDKQKDASLDALKEVEAAALSDADADVISPLDVEASLLPEADAAVADAPIETSEDVQQEPDAVQQPDTQIEDVQLDKNVEPDVEPPPDAKPEAQVSTLCQQYMQGVDDFVIIGQSPIGGTVRISIFGYVDFPADSGLSDTTKSGWCWGSLGQITVACKVPVPGIVTDTDIFVHPGISLGDGDPQTAPLCELGICNKTYTLCFGPYVIGIVDGNVTSPGTNVPDQTIKYHVP